MFKGGLDKDYKNKSEYGRILTLNIHAHSPLEIN